MTSMASTYASYSARSSGVSLPSLHFSASSSTLSCTSGVCSHCREVLSEFDGHHPLHRLKKLGENAIRGVLNLAHDVNGSMKESQSCFLQIWVNASTAYHFTGSQSLLANRMQQFRNLADFDQLRRRQGTTTVGFTAFSPGGSAAARFSRGVGRPSLGTRRSFLGTPHRRIDEGSSESTWASSATPFRQRGGKNPVQGARANCPNHGARQPTTLRSNSRASQSVSAPRTPPA